jgi:hypothetical protein
LDRHAKARITKEMAEAAQKIATKAASGDLGGDPKFSGWRPELDTQIKSLSNGAAILMPTRVSAGPWTVAERGRNQGNAGGFAGPGINTRTGRTSRRKDGSVRKVRSRQSRRWNGTTTGKDTASKAVAAMQRALPKLAEDGVRKTILKRFDLN